MIVSMIVVELRWLCVLRHACSVVALATSYPPMRLDTRLTC